jgi:hypothetical protein
MSLGGMPALAIVPILLPEIPAVVRGSDGRTPRRTEATHDQGHSYRAETISWPVVPSAWHSMSTEA